MSSPTASSSMTMPAASCQSPARAACRTASVSMPFRSYHRAARRCRAATPPGSDRLDERVRAYQGRQNSRGLVVTGQLDCRIGVEVLQDAGAQQDLTNLRRLDVEHLLHQVADQCAVLSDQFL